jgi:hypothetical protein
MADDEARRRFGLKLFGVPPEARPGDETGLRQPEPALDTGPEQPDAVEQPEQADTSAEQPEQPEAEPTEDPLAALLGQSADAKRESDLKFLAMLHPGTKDDDE